MARVFREALAQPRPGVALRIIERADYWDALRAERQAVLPLTSLEHMQARNTGVTGRMQPHPRGRAQCPARVSG